MADMTVTTTRKILKRALLVGALLAAALGGGCAEDPCDELLEVCNRCESTTRRSCSSSVQADDSQTCEYLIDFYVSMCP